ncbi:prolyl aminopeptidase [Ureaplasma sp. ES3154-GEN]|uniref:prolyl aminopeptidase n=1 Tax=Ureaplasma sp. ES3154-GEN TaxID=2984844 RepID=UPI0021E8D198|nr:prolyl aminopeptidase [Ureaplasma sp. ES3154-GEN]MCV3743338.1 prolyl aminopeptidase [Ureaplasma sp. ES3154-GEN]
MPYKKYLYPKTTPWYTGYITTSDKHQIYYELSGNKNGIPVVYVHGGPGGSVGSAAHRFFDPKKYFVITFDQRGCGKSKPFLSLENNTTHHLVEDMQLLKRTLNIEKWVIFGGSWGTTLALVYAIKYPEDVRSLLLRGVFLARASSIKWLYQDGANMMRPVEYEQFVDGIPEEERSDVIKAYHKLLNSYDPAVMLAAAYQWNDWETSLVSVNDQKWPKRVDREEFAVAKLENHYFYNNSFLEENYILNNADVIKNIKTYIVHGAFDLDCRPIDAYDLHKKLPNSELYIVKKAGHTTRDIPLLKQILEILDEKIK